MAIITFVSFGILIGWVMPNLVFLPLTHVLRAIQETSLQLDGGGTNHLLVVVAIGAASTMCWAILARRSTFA